MMRVNRKTIATTMAMLIFVVLYISSATLFASGNVDSEDTKTQNKVLELESLLEEDPQNTKLCMELAIIYHGKAADGEKQAIEKAEPLFKKILDAEPNNAEVRAWYGSLLTIKGREDWFPPAKLFYVIQGIQQMDRAVELSPDSTSVRLVRGHTSVALPYAFGRNNVAIKDFEYLLTLDESKPGQFDANTLAGIYLDLGKAYSQGGDKDKARENWQKAMDIAPGSKEAVEANSLLGN